MKIAVVQGLVQSHPYDKYRSIVSSLYSQGISTGKESTPELVHYTELNEARMNRLDKKMVLSEGFIQKLIGLKKHYIWLVLSEGWCGDAAQILPILNKMASVTQRIELKIALRDENESLMNLFLTNGSKSIPKLLVLEKDSLEVIGTWGPRPIGATDLMQCYKRQYGQIDNTAKKELQLWYLHDKGRSTQKEIVELMLFCEQLNLQTK